MVTQFLNRDAFVRRDQGRIPVAQWSFKGTPTNPGIRTPANLISTWITSDPDVIQTVLPPIPGPSRIFAEAILTGPDEALGTPEAEGFDYIVDLANTNNNALFPATVDTSISAAGDASCTPTYTPDKRIKIDKVRAIVGIFSGTVSDWTEIEWRLCVHTSAGEFVKAQNVDFGNHATAFSMFLTGTPDTWGVDKDSNPTYEVELELAGSNPLVLEAGESYVLSLIARWPDATASIGVLESSSSGDTGHFKTVSDFGALVNLPQSDHDGIPALQIKATEWGVSGIISGELDVDLWVKRYGASSPALSQPLLNARFFTHSPTRKVIPLDALVVSEDIITRSLVHTPGYEYGITYNALFSYDAPPELELLVTVYQEKALMDGGDDPVLHAGFGGGGGPSGPVFISEDTDTDIEGVLKGEDGKVAQAVADTDYATPALVQQRMRYRGEIDFDGVTYYPGDVVYYPFLLTLASTGVGGFVTVTTEFTTALDYYGFEPGPNPFANPELFSPRTLEAGGIQTAISTLQSKQLLHSSFVSNLTLGLSNLYRVLRWTTSNNRTITVPPQTDVAWPNGAHTRIVREGTGAVTIIPGDGVTINNQFGILEIDRRYGEVDLVRITENNWILFGDTPGYALKTVNTQLWGVPIGLGQLDRTILSNSGSSPHTLTIPPQSDVPFTSGFRVHYFRRSTGTATVVPGTGVTINNQHGSLSIAKTHGMLTVWRRGEDDWVVIGDTIDPSPVGHTHTESDITDLDKYTQSEVDSALAGKANTSHTHTESDITDLGDYIEKVEDDATPKLGGNLDADNKNITALRRALLPAIVKGSLGSSETFDFAEASAFTGIVNDNATYTISNLAPGQRATIELTTSGIGGPFAIIWAGIDGWAQSEVLDEVAIGVSDYLIVTLWNSGSKVSAIFDEFGA